MKIISKVELEKLLAGTEKFFLLDTREPEEFEAGHIEQSILAPWHSVTNKTDGLSKQTPLILYCNTGVRAQKAAHFLEQQGFINISLYPGGWMEWSS